MMKGQVINPDKLKRKRKANQTTFSHVRPKHKFNQNARKRRLWCSK
jgi:hypothetical protein